MTDEAVYTAWCEALRHVWLLAKAERARELRGDRRVRGFDKRGLHTLSEAWGRVFAFEELRPDLAAVRRHEGEDGEHPADPVPVARMAARAAEAEFVAELHDQNGEGVFS